MEFLENLIVKQRVECPFLVASAHRLYVIPELRALKSYLMVSTHILVRNLLVDSGIYQKWTIKIVLALRFILVLGRILGSTSNVKGWAYIIKPPLPTPPITSPGNNVS